MATQTPASTIIQGVAKEVLGPLGLRRKGRSRSWLDDRGWWLGNVEFQPSSGSQGSYLNVGVMWLWQELPYFVYNVGYRVHEFEPYKDPEQFQEVATELARMAADEVSRYRVTFASPTACAEYYANVRDVAPNSFLDAGIAHGLVGRAREAKSWFDAHLAIADDREFVIEEKRRVDELRNLLDNQPEFERRIRVSIVKTRDLLRLPALADWPF